MGSWQVNKTTGQAVSGHHRVVVSKSEFESRAELKRARDWDWVVVKSTKSDRWAPGVLRIVKKADSTAGIAWPIREAIGVRPKVDEVDLIVADGIQRLGWRHQSRKRLFAWPDRLVIPLERIQRRSRSLMPTVHVMGGVIKGELTLAEANAVVVEELTLDALGIESGDEVYLTSAKLVDGRFQIVRKAVKAYKETDVARSRRFAPAPSPESSTNKFVPRTQLPNIWMGDALRIQLGVVPVDGRDEDRPEVRTSCVVISPSRWFAMKKNLREAAIVLSLAALGFKDQIQELQPDYFYQISLTLGIGIPLFMIWYRVRTMLR